MNKMDKAEELVQMAEAAVVVSLQTVEKRALLAALASIARSLINIEKLIDERFPPPLLEHFGPYTFSAISSPETDVTDG